MPYLSGYHSVNEALRSRPHDVRRILIGPRAASGRAKMITALAERHGVVVKDTPNARLAELVSDRHQGFVADLRPAVGREKTHADVALVVLVEGVQDPRNLGALLRVCEGAGVGRVLIRDRGSSPITPTVVHTSAGATEWLEIERFTNTARVLEELKEDGFWIYGAVEGAQAPWTIDLTGKVVLCVGGEEKGLRARTRTLCDALVGLPMRGRIESLNLATAAAALLYEAVRQRTC